jgi:Zn-dependent protease
MVMAVMWMLFAIALVALNVGESFFIQMAEAGVKTNLVIFAFNLFPIPPLDGGRIVTSLLPNRYAYKFAQLEPYGFFIVLGLMLVNGLKYWMAPVMGAAAMALQFLVSPFTFFLK